MKKNILRLLLILIFLFSGIANGEDARPGKFKNDPNDPNAITPTGTRQIVNLGGLNVLIAIPSQYDFATTTARDTYFSSHASELVSGRKVHIQATGFIQNYTGSAWENITALTRGATGQNGVDGQDGADGADGKTILSGIITPTTEGDNGDFYINTATNTIYGPKADGVWPAGVPLGGYPGVSSDGAGGLNATGGGSFGGPVTMGSALLNGKPWIDVTHPDYGAIGDAIAKNDGSATNGDNTFTSASSSFTSADIGKTIIIANCGAAGIYITTTIASINSPTSIELTNAPSTTAINLIFWYGTDNSTAIQTAINTAEIVYIPAGRYIIATSLAMVDGVRVFGAGCQNTNATLGIRGTSLVSGVGNANPTVAWVGDQFTSFTDIHFEGYGLNCISLISDSYNATIARVSERNFKAAAAHYHFEDSYYLSVQDLFASGGDDAGERESATTNLYIKGYCNASTIMNFVTSSVGTPYGIIVEDNAGGTAPKALEIINPVLQGQDRGMQFIDCQTGAITVHNLYTENIKKEVAVLGTVEGISFIGGYWATTSNDGAGGRVYPTIQLNSSRNCLFQGITFSNGSTTSPVPHIFLNGLTQGTQFLNCNDATEEWEDRDLFQHVYKVSTLNAYAGITITNSGDNATKGRASSGVWRTSAASHVYAEWYFSDAGTGTLVIAERSPSDLVISGP